MSTSDTLKALTLINGMTAEKMRLVLILLAARLPFSVIAAATDIPNGDVGVEAWPTTPTLGDLLRDSEVIPSTDPKRYVRYVYSYEGDFVDFCVFPEFVKELQFQTCKLSAIKWLRNKRSTSLVAAKTIVEWLAYYGHIDSKFLGNNDSWNTANFSRIKINN